MGTVWVAGVSRQGGRDRAGGDVTLPSLVCWSQWARARWGQRGQQSPSPEAAAADTHTQTHRHTDTRWKRMETWTIYQGPLSASNLSSANGEDGENGEDGQPRDWSFTPWLRGLRQPLPPPSVRTAAAAARWAEGNAPAPSPGPCSGPCLSHTPEAGLHPCRRAGQQVFLGEMPLPRKTF